MKINILAAATLSLAISAHAQAADRFAGADTPSAPEVFDWSGFYLGVNGGYGWTSGESGGITERFYGGVLGAHAGYNMQFGSWVLGGEAELAHSWNHESYGGGVLEVGTDWQASLRARAGYAIDRTLVYATGGLVLTNFYQHFPGFAVTRNERLTGWTIGGGLEHAFTDNWIVRAEYRYSDYGDMRSLGPNIPIIEHTTRAGISYKF